jgi:hypothetical protein
MALYDTARGCLTPIHFELVGAEFNATEDPLYNRLRGGDCSRSPLLGVLA